MRDGNATLQAAQNLTVDCVLATVLMPKPSVSWLANTALGKGIRKLLGNLIKGSLRTYQGPRNPTNRLRVLLLAGL